MIASGTTPGGRFDQFMYPFYKNDKEKGLITEHDVLELLECLRIKIMQYNFVGGGKLQREKWSGKIPSNRCYHFCSFWKTI